MTTEVRIQTGPFTGATTRCHRLLLADVGSSLGRVLRECLSKYTGSLRLSDILNLGEARTGKETVPYNLADVKAIDALVAGMDTVVHLGGVSVERPFGEILPANITDTHNLYKAARRHGVRRIVFVSPNHITGFYKQDETTDNAVPTKPDGYYGLSKVFDEQFVSFYFDRYGIKTIAIRIGSSSAEAEDHHMLVAWLGYDDLEQLIRHALLMPNMGFTVACGISNNRDRQWDNRHVAYFGYIPTQTSEIFRTQVEVRPPLPADDPAA